MVYALNVREDPLSIRHPIALQAEGTAIDEVAAEEVEVVELIKPRLSVTLEESTLMNSLEVVSVLETLVVLKVTAVLDRIVVEETVELVS